MAGIKLKWKEVIGNIDNQKSEAVSLLRDILAKQSLQRHYRAFSSKHNFRGGNEIYRFLVIIEKGSQSYGAYSPDLPGCVAVGDTREEVEKNMREAIIMHLQGMIEDHEPIPTSQTTAEYMDISIPSSAA